MNKKIKITLIIVTIIILCLSIYIIIDGIRLRNSEVGTKPLIILKIEETENRIIYYGLGYSISYYVDRNKIIKDDFIMIEESGYGADFKLFNKILIWGWVE